MSDLLEKKVDKFHNKTELVTKQVTLWSDSKLYDYGLSGQRNDIRAKFRYWSDQDGETFLLDVDYGGPDWLFLREGDIVIRINNTKNIELKPSGEDTDVHTNEQHKIICREVLYYEVKKEDFIDICQAKSLEFQISGSRSFVTGEAENLQAMARVLYDNLFEPAFDTKELEEKLRSKKESVIFSIFTFPISFLAGGTLGQCIDNISEYGDLGYLYLVLSILFCVINFFLPYSKRAKWISYGIFVIFAIIAYAF